jgi:hypothetical protein
MSRRMGCKAVQMALPGGNGWNAPMAAFNG